jgi:ArsR family transcriptional regulator
VEALRNGELPAGAIIERLGLEQANASQHLAVLRTKQIVNSRKEGNQVFYSVRDPVLIEVLDIMRRYFQTHLDEAMSMLREIDRSEKENS